jgi:hypothetical protein
MVHKSSVVPGLSRFIDESVLSHYPPTSMKRILMAGAVSLYLKQNEGLVDTLTSNPLFTALGVVDSSGMIDLDKIRDVLKTEIKKAGFVRLTVPFAGDIDFTLDDVDLLYRMISEEYSRTVTTPQTLTAPIAPSGGIY